MGVVSEGFSSPYDVSVQVVGADGVYRAERGLVDVGVPWVLHLQAPEASLAPGIVKLSSVLRTTTISMIVILAVAVTVYAALWRPLTQLRHAAYHDVLTGLATRRRLHQSAPSLIERAHREGGFVAVAIMDLDNFKRLNDSVGHKAGDTALQVVAHALHAQARQGDLMVRWGGDEFVAVLTMDDGADPVPAVERLRSDVQEALVSRFPHVEGLGVTAGVTRSTSAHDRIEALIKAADEALVEGKKQAKASCYVALLLN